MKSTENNREIDALVSLMDEPNDDIYTEVRKKIISHGTQAIPVLEEAWLHTFNAPHSQRLENTIEEIKFHKTVGDIFDWLDNPMTHPTEFIHIISAYLNEHYQTETQQKWINMIYRDTWLELNESLTALEKVNIMNHVFYKVYKLNNFLPDQNQFEGFFFDFLQHNKKGNALLLGLLYLTIAQKLKLPLSGINLPNQFVLAYLDREEPAVNINKKDLKQEDILFYINPSNLGALFTQKEITGYLKHIGVERKKEHYLPCNRKELCVRFLEEIYDGLIAENRSTKAQYIQSLIQILNQTPDETGSSLS